MTTAGSPARRWIERALQRLLADITAGRVDIVVVYKIDRLTRSLTDFAKIVDILDASSLSDLGSDAHNVVKWNGLGTRGGGG